MATSDKAIVCVTMLGAVGLALALFLGATGVVAPLLAVCIGAFSWAAVWFMQAARVLLNRQRRLRVG